MDTPPQALPLEEMVRRYSNQWVLVEETAWDARAYPTVGIVRAASVTHGGIYGSRYAAVITTGQAKPSYHGSFDPLTLHKRCRCTLEFRASD
jgi:hypothetical protein